MIRTGSHNAQEAWWRRIVTVHGRDRKSQCTGHDLPVHVGSPLRFMPWGRSLWAILILQSSVCQIGGPVVQTSGSLYGGTTRFNSRANSFLLLLMIL